MTDKAPMPASMQALSQALMAARDTALAHDAAMLDVHAAAINALPDAQALGMQVLAVGPGLVAVHDAGGNYAKVLAAHVHFDKLRKALGLAVPIQATRGPGGGR